MFKLKEKQTQNQSLGTIKYIVISIQICLNVNFMEETFNFNSLRISYSKSFITINWQFDKKWCIICL